MALNDIERRRIEKAVGAFVEKRRPAPHIRPALDGDAYIANGDLGIVVGHYKGQKSKIKGCPRR